MIEILAASLISNLLIYTYGCVFIRYFFTKNFSHVENLAENSIFGVILKKKTKKYNLFASLYRSFISISYLKNIFIIYYHYSQLGNKMG